MQKSSRSQTKKSSKKTSIKEASVIDKIEKLYEKAAKKSNEEVKKNLEERKNDKKTYHHFNDVIPESLHDYTNKLVINNSF